MDNSLLAVRDITYKYIVVERRMQMVVFAFSILTSFFRDFSRIFKCITI